MKKEKKTFNPLGKYCSFFLLAGQLKKQRAKLIEEVKADIEATFEFIETTTA